MLWFTLQSLFTILMAFGLGLLVGRLYWGQVWRRLPRWEAEQLLEESDARDRAWSGESGTAHGFDEDDPERTPFFTDGDDDAPPSDRGADVGPGPLSSPAATPVPARTTEPARRSGPTPRSGTFRVPSAAAPAPAAESDGAREVRAVSPAGDVRLRPRADRSGRVSRFSSVVNRLTSTGEGGHDRGQRPSVTESPAGPASVPANRSARPSGTDSRQDTASGRRPADAAGRSRTPDARPGPAGQSGVPANPAARTRRPPDSARLTGNPTGHPGTPVTRIPDPAAGTPNAQPRVPGGGAAGSARPSDRPATRPRGAPSQDRTARTPGTPRTPGTARTPGTPGTARTPGAPRPQGTPRPPGTGRPGGTEQPQETDRPTRRRPSPPPVAQPGDGSATEPTRDTGRGVSRWVASRLKRPSGAARGTRSFDEPGFDEPDFDEPGTGGRVAGIPEPAETFASYRPGPDEAAPAVDAEAEHRRQEARARRWAEETSAGAPQASAATWTDRPYPPSPEAAQPTAVDNLQRIQGIGPKTAVALRRTGIQTFADLARTSELALRDALLDSGVRPSPSLPTWTRQAGLLAAGDEEGFAAIAVTAEHRDAP